MYKRLFALLFVLVSCFVQLGHTQEISRYMTVLEALDATTDYELEFNQLEVISEKPLHIRVSPIIMADDILLVIDEELKRALVRSVLRAFIHTDVDQVKITVQPQLVESFKPYKAAILDTPKYTVDITRSHAQGVINRLLKIEGFNGLVGSRLGGVYMADFWNPAIEHIFYNDQQAPGLNVLYKELGAK